MQNMDKKLPQWIDPKDPKQWAWAVSYLAKKSLLAMPPENRDEGSIQGWEDILRGLNSPTNPDSIKTLERMKRAWEQRQRRQKLKLHGRISFCFEMDKEVKGHLQRLKKASKIPVSDIVQGLITREHEILQGLRKQIKGLKNSLKNSGTGAEITVLRRTKSRLEKKAELEWERIEALTRQLCEAEICLEAHGLSRTSLTTNQEISVSAKTAQLLASYRAHIRSEISEFKARESRLK